MAATWNNIGRRVWPNIPNWGDQTCKEFSWTGENLAAHRSRTELHDPSKPPEYSPHPAFQPHELPLIRSEWLKSGQTVSYQRSHLVDTAAQVYDARHPLR